MIPKYPDFTQLDISHKQQVTELTSQYAPYSDFNFTSLFCWNTDGTTEISMLGNNLVIRIPDYLDGHPVYSILGTHEVDESLDVLLNVSSEINLIPEVVTQAIRDSSKYTVTEDENNFDYIYDLHHLSDLPGGRYKKKRNKANSFTTDHEHLELEVKIVNVIDQDHAEMLKQIDRDWADHKTQADGDIQSERKALGLLLDNFAEFEATVTEVWVNGVIKAFSINEILAGKFAICHFEKAIKVHHAHLNTFLAIEVSKQLRLAGCRFVNWEQDLGLEGLRKSKQSYHPSQMLKKYTVSSHR